MEEKISEVIYDDDAIITVTDDNGNLLQIRFIKSFMAKLSQSSDEVKEYYNTIKKHALSYQNTTARTSWHYEAINAGKEHILRFTIRGKTLGIYYPLFEVDDKYKVEMIRGKRYEDTPCLYRIKNDRRCEYAKELIDIVMRKLHISKGFLCTKDFYVPYEDTCSLLSNGLIKEFKTKVLSSKKVEESISVEEADQKMSDEVAAGHISERVMNKKRNGKKCTVSIDTRCENFQDGDIVDIEALLDKKIIPSSVGHVKVMARGKLGKKLHLKLQDYSLQAVKMVILKGGTVELIK